MQRILVVGGTGTVGSRLVAALTERGAEVRVMTRSPEDAGEQPSGAVAVRGDLTRPDTLGPAFEGAQAVYLLTPLAQDEVEQGLAGVEAARRAGVERLVFQSVHRAEEGSHIPHFASKLEIIEGIREAGLEHTILEPNNFYQNDLWVRGAILGGIYPQPLGPVGLHRVDARDIAAAAATALLDDAHSGKSYPVVGPEALTGERTAAIWSEVLGREVVYAGDDLDAWEARAREAMPGWLVEDLRVMFAWFIEEGLLASGEEMARQHELLGREPRAFEEFAREAAEGWTG